MKELIGRYAYEVEAFHVDYTGRLSFGFLGNKMLIAADHQANERGFGKKVLVPDGKSWVISRLAVEMKEFPKEYDKYYIETWVESVNRYFSSRCFRVLNEREEVIGYARSMWALIDMKTRQVVDLTSYCGGAMLDCVCDEPCPIAGVSKARVQSTEPVGHFTPVYSDIDYNGHLNSIKYVEHILNEVPLDVFRQHFVKRVEVTYSEECLYREQLDVLMDHEPDSAEYDFEVRKPSGSTACRAKVFFS